MHGALGSEIRCIQTTPDRRYSRASTLLGTTQDAGHRTEIHPPTPKMLPGAALYHQHLTEAARLSHELMGDCNDALRAELEATANQLARPGRGLLAADESVGTIGKRLVAAGLENKEETRRAYREVLFAHPDLGQYLRCGAVLIRFALVGSGLHVYIDRYRLLTVVLNILHNRPTTYPTHPLQRRHPPLRDAGAEGGGRHALPRAPQGKGRPPRGQGECLCK